MAAFVTCDQHTSDLQSTLNAAKSYTDQNKVTLNQGTSLPADATDCTKALTACGLLAMLNDTSASGNAILNKIKSLMGGVNRPPVSSLPSSLVDSTIGSAIAPVNLTGTYFTDPDGDTLTYTATGIPPGITITSAGYVSGTPTTIGNYTTSITANDGRGGTVTATTSWKVLANSGTNNPPVSSLPSSLTDSIVGVAVGTVNLTGTYFTDPNGDTLTYTATGLPPGVTCSTSGIVSGTPTTAGTYNPSFTANDGRGGTVTATTSWIVRPAVVNNPPVSTLPSSLTDSTVGVSVGTVNLTGTYFSDPDGDTLTYTATGIPPGVNMTTAGVVSGTPTIAGTYNISITANDGRGGTVTDTASWTVRPAVVNNPPTSSLPSALGDSIVGQTIAPTSLNSYFSDPDGDSLSYTVTGLPPGITVTSAGLVSGTPTTAGTYTTSVTANDGRGGTVTATTSWKVLAAVNNPPVSSLPSSVEDSIVGIAISPVVLLNSYFSDPDGDTLSYTATGLPPGINVSSEGIVSGTPTTVGTYNPSVTANDGKGGTVTASTSWTIIP